mgnify:CR=1 FL=1
MRKIIQTILQASDSGSLTKIIFAGKRKKSLEYSKITLRPVTIRGEYMYQAEFHFEKKVTHQNIPYHEMIDYASQWICEDFKQINILTEAEDIQILAADPENPRITRRAYKKLRKAAVLDHNRKKHYIIEDGKPCVLWLASWDWIDIPTCTIPQPRMITPSALMMLKIKSERLFTISSGSPPAAIAGVTQQRQRAAAPAAVQ